MPDQDEYENLNIEQHLREAKVNGNQNRVSQILQADASIKSQACWFDISKLIIYFNIATLDGRYIDIIGPEEQSLKGAHLHTQYLGVD